MRITITPANSKDQYIIEGDAQELNTIIQQIVTTQTKPIKAQSVQAPKHTGVPAIKKSPFENAEAFLNSLYVYQASLNDSGKGRYIAEILMDGNVHIEAELISSLKTSKKVIDGNISRLRSGGAVISTTSGMIQIMSIPTEKRFIRKRRTVKNKTQRANKSNRKVLVAPTSEQTKSFLTS